MVRLAALAACLLASAASAQCVKDGLVLFPTPGAVVPTNVRFILEGTGKEQARVLGLVGSSAAVLRSGSEAISVRVERGWVSAMNRVAVRLTPSKPLSPGREYTLFLSGFDGYRLINDGHRDNSLRWTSGSEADRMPPKLMTRPAITEGNHKVTPEGTTRWLKLRATISEAGPMYFLVTMRRARGSSVKQTYPAPLDGDAAVLGHDACSGGFGFEDGRAYKLEIELFDSAGNRSPKTSRIEISAPRPL